MVGELLGASKMEWAHTHKIETFAWWREMNKLLLQN